MLARFKSNQGHVAIVGLGYVGLPLSIAFIEAGYTVTGFDIDPEKVTQLNRGETYIRHISDAAIEFAQVLSAESEARLLREVEEDAAQGVEAALLKEHVVLDQPGVVITQVTAKKRRQVNKQERQTE